MDKLKWAFAICAVLAILGSAVVPMTGQQGWRTETTSSIGAW
jgi:hypothetical protein